MRGGQQWAPGGSSVDHRREPIIRESAPDRNMLTPRTQAVGPIPSDSQEDVYYEQNDPDTLRPLPVALPGHSSHPERPSAAGRRPLDIVPIHKESGCGAREFFSL